MRGSEVRPRFDHRGDQKGQKGQEGDADSVPHVHPVSKLQALRRDSGGVQAE